MIVEVESKAVFQEALKESVLIVVDFFATWCGPCKMITPLLEKHSNQYTKAKFLKVDVDKFPELAQEYGITSMPTIIFFRDGSVVDKIIGANPRVIEDALSKYA